MKQTFIKVTSSFDETGYMLPKTIFWKDKPFPIDEIVSFRPADPPYGQGDSVQCCTVRIQGEEKHLFFEKVNSGNAPRYGKWFVLTRA